MDTCMDQKTPRKQQQEKMGWPRGRYRPAGRERPCKIVQYYGYVQEHEERRAGLRRGEEECRMAIDGKEPKKRFANWVRSVDTWTNAGKRHEANGNLLLAIDCYRQALAFSGETDEKVWWLLALAFYEIRALDDAINCCANILALNPYNRPALDGLHRWQVELELLSESGKLEEGAGVNEAAVSIQAVFRAKQDRKRVKQLREEQNAATSMQCMYRRRQAQKKVQRRRERKYGRNEREREKRK